MLIYQERGLHLHANFDIDEETRFSSVLREVDIGEDNEDRIFDSHNDETFGGSSGSAVGRHVNDLTTGKSCDVAQVSSSSSSVVVPYTFNFFIWKFSYLG